MNYDEESYRKHLEFAQLNIARMAVASFAYKSWMVAIISALYAAYAASQKADLILVAAIPTVLFWVLDAFHLAAEKKFRLLYDDIREQKVDQFKMVPPPITVSSWVSAGFSKTLLPLYVPVLIFIGVSYCVLS